MSKGGDQQTTSTAVPWSLQQPFLAGTAGGPRPTMQNTLGALPAAAQWFGSGAGSQFFPDQTVAPFNPTQLSALDMIRQRAGGSPVQSAAQNFVTGALQPGAPNAFLDPVFADIQNRVQGAVGSAFEGSGRTGSPLHALNLSNEITKAYSPFAFNAAESAANRQLAAAQLAPGIAGMDWQNLAALQGVGAQHQAQTQAEINAARERFEFEQGNPLARLQQYAQLVSGLGLGNYGATSQPQFTNPAAGVLGGAASGAGLGMAFGPWGALAGGLFGGLMGGFG